MKNFVSKKRRSVIRKAKSKFIKSMKRIHRVACKAGDQDIANITSFAIALKYKDWNQD